MPRECERSLETFLYLDSKTITHLVSRCTADSHFQSFSAAITFN
jgi:hypothetical protein